MVWTSLSSYGGFFGAVVGGFYWRWQAQAAAVSGARPDCLRRCRSAGSLAAWAASWCTITRAAITDFFLAVDNFPYNGVIGPRHDLGFYEVLWSALVVPLFLLARSQAAPARLLPRPDLLSCTHRCASGSTFCAKPTGSGPAG